MNQSIWTKAVGTVLVFSSLIACGQEGRKEMNEMGADVQLSEEEKGELEQIALGAGCFWCVEAVFQELEGVKNVESGYSNGNSPNEPSYKDVCTGTTGYVEVARITFDPNVITLPEILEVFWKTHDPTTLNKQGNDVGDQYRSGIYYLTEAQQKVAEELLAELDESGAWDSPIVTEIEPLENFFMAENYHQDYYMNNPEQGYCAYVIQPKLDKFRKVFQDKLKKSN